MTNTPLSDALPIDWACPGCGIDADENGVEVVWNWGTRHLWHASCLEPTSTTESRMIGDTA